VITPKGGGRGACVRRYHLDSGCDAPSPQVPASPSAPGEGRVWVTMMGESVTVAEIFLAEIACFHGPPPDTRFGWEGESGTPCPGKQWLRSAEARGSTTVDAAISLLSTTRIHIQFVNCKQSSMHFAILFNCM